MLRSLIRFLLRLLRWLQRTLLRGTSTKFTFPFASRTMTASWSASLMSGRTSTTVSSAEGENRPGFVTRRCWPVASSRTKHALFASTQTLLKGVPAPQNSSVAPGNTMRSPASHRMRPVAVSRSFTYSFTFSWTPCCTPFFCPASSSSVAVGNTSCSPLQKRTVPVALSSRRMYSRRRRAHAFWTPPSTTLTNGSTKTSASPLT
mmetsp:Transcript_11755/g.23776  ORF Transcript_11755/g.23776 Transcript_11755/m.23776 type:complete len:204 (-) Transcript_11755:627-1238(-)